MWARTTLYGIEGYWGEGTVADLVVTAYHWGRSSDVALPARIPRKHRQAQIDGVDIERVDPLFQIDAKRLPGIQTTGDSNERQGNPAVDSPVAHFVVSAGVKHGAVRSRSLRHLSQVMQYSTFALTSDCSEHLNLGSFDCDQGGGIFMFSVRTISRLRKNYCGS